MSSLIFREPWSDILDDGLKHMNALESELSKELYQGHQLFGLNLKLLAKREDSDDILVTDNQNFYVVHLTWSGKNETGGFPSTFKFKSQNELQEKLDGDCAEYDI